MAYAESKMNQLTGTIKQTSYILQCGKLCDESTDSISSFEKCENIREKALLWSGVDKFAMQLLIGTKVLPDMIRVH